VRQQERQEVLAEAARVVVEVLVAEVHQEIVEALEGDLSHESN